MDFVEMNNVAIASMAYSTLVMGQLLFKYIFTPGISIPPRAKL